MDDPANLCATHPGCNIRAGSKLVEPVLPGPRKRYRLMLRKTGIAA